MSTTPTPIIWSVAGTDSGGGAGLAADQRAADALGVHCCTVVAGITAQSTTEVTHIEDTPPAVLQAQLDTLWNDMPPRVIKTGLLGSAENVRVLAAFIDRLRAQQPLAQIFQYHPQRPGVDRNVVRGDEQDVIVAELLLGLLLEQESTDELQSQLGVDVRVQRRDVGCDEHATLRGHSVQLEIVDERLGVLHQPGDRCFLQDLLQQVIGQH